MKKLAGCKWFQWLTKYWFLVPVVAFPLFAAAVFLAYGERSYIGVHDNMDLFLAQFQMLKNTGAFWKHGVDAPFLGGVSRDNLPSELSLYSLLYMLFPTYTAYILGILGKILLGMFSFRLLAAELFPERYRLIRPIVYMTGLCYGTLWVFPAFGFAFASIPLCVFLLLKIYRRKEARWGWWYAALFAYPLVSYFSYHGLFILGYLVLVILWLFGRWLLAGRAGTEKKALLRMLAALFVLAAGYVLCEYRLFGQMLLGDEVTIRSSIVNASLAPAEIAAEIVQVFREGIFHADSVHGKVVLPVCALYFAINNICYIIKREWKRIPRDPFNLLMVFILFNCVVYGLYDFEPLRSFVERLIPQLKGWQFNRTIFFNPLLWYAALFLVLLRLYEGGILRVWLANGIVCLALLTVILTPNRYNDLYHTCYNRAYEFYHGAEVDELSYEQFYAVDLFDEIKADIGYQGEWAAAYGFHPAVLEYNGIASLDGYLGFYPQSYKEAFREVIAPALERVEETRIYYDDWGARAYLYSGTDLSIVQAAKTVYATDDRIYIDGEAFRKLGGEYLFSRIRLSNAEETGLSLLGEYTAADESMTIYVYRYDLTE
ncbi:MAG: DUF6044 family protein [Bacteroidales bacterium]|nr:DUF6044 family protein [Bacteroidales bacterium]MCM1414482.1 DUF6044 family protein [bacterium]MCM1423744.1 DUF6044 family protein [bacterium]